jgi:hypothetical protein
VQQRRAAVALHQKLAAEIGYPDLTKTKEAAPMAEKTEAKHEAKEHKQLDLWAQTIQAGRAVQQAAETQKAPTKQTDPQREL